MSGESAASGESVASDAPGKMGDIAEDIHGATPGAERIAALFLDVGGVLGTNGWDRRARQRAAQVFGLDYAEMDERHHLTFDTYEQGKLGLDEYLRRVVFYEPRPFTPQAFKDHLFDQSQPYPDMLGLIRRVKAQLGLKVAVVSNEGRELAVHRVAKFGLGAFVDFFIFSSFVHFRKPDPDIYRLALDVAQVSAGRVLYVDDRAMFVEVARGLGIRGLQHTDYQATAAALAGLAASTASGKV